MKIDEIRRANARKLMQEEYGTGRGAMQKFADRIERSLTWCAASLGLQAGEG